MPEQKPSEQKPSMAGSEFVMGVYLIGNPGDIKETDEKEQDERSQLPQFLRM